METEEKVFYFQDHALVYALKNSVGELSPELMMPRGLARLLRESGEGADYWRTLEVYLDHEMNASRTARELFIHRTTLQNRLSRISRFVDLDSPDIFILFGIIVIFSHYFSYILQYLQIYLSTIP